MLQPGNLSVRPPKRPHTERLWGIVVCGRIHGSRLFKTKKEADASCARRMTLGLAKHAQVRPILITPVSARASIADMTYHQQMVTSATAKARKRKARKVKVPLKK